MSKQQWLQDQEDLGRREADAFEFENHPDPMVRLAWIGAMFDVAMIRRIESEQGYKDHDGW